jgi:large subunit ribosomal protein L15e
MYRHLEEAWKRPAKSYVQDLMRQRVIAWRRQPAVNRVEKPTRLDRAHRLGYKAKKGIVVVRVRVRRGGAHKLRAYLAQVLAEVLKHTPQRAYSLLLSSAEKFINLSVEQLLGLAGWCEQVV